MDEVAKQERKAELLAAEDEALDHELSVAQKKAAIREAKRMYGRDWRKIIGGAVRSVKVDLETLQSLHSLGTSGERLRQHAKLYR